MSTIDLLFDYLVMILVDYHTIVILEFFFFFQSLAYITKLTTSNQYGAPHHV